MPNSRKPKSRPARSRKYRIADGVAHRQIDGQTLVLLPADNSLVTLNATGQFIWTRLGRPRSLEDIARALVRAFRVPPAAALADAEQFVGLLEGKRLVTRE